MSKSDPTLEREVEQPASKYAKLRRWFEIKIMRASRNGFPDRFYARRVPTCPHCGNETNVLLVEYKRPGGGRLSESQIERIAELRAAGVRVEVIDDLERAREVLR